MRKNIYFFCAVLAILRIIYVLHAPYALAPDESYMWEWARHLDWGYFDMGPMVAWSTALSLKLFGVNELAMRLVPIVFSAATSVLLYETAVEILALPAAGLAAVLLFNFTPLGAAGSIISTYYSQQLFFWALSLLLFQKAIHHGGTRRWLIWGAGPAGGGLLSHHTSFVLNAQLALYLLLSDKSRFWLRRKEPYLAALAAVLVFSPLLIWNMHHDMAMFRHGPGQMGNRSSVFATFVDFIGGQLGVITPLIWIGTFCAVAWAGYKGLVEKHDERLFLFLTSAPVFAYVGCLCFLRRTEANWPSAAYVAGFIALGDWFVSALKEKKWARIYSWSALAMGAAAAVLIHFPLITSALPPAKDPTNRLYGWRELGTELSRLRRQMPGSFLCAMNYAIPGELSFYTEDHPPAYSLPVNTRRDQFDYWNINQEIGKDALYVKIGDGEIESAVRPLFADVSLVSVLKIPKDANHPDILRKTFSIFQCRGYKGFFGERANKF